MTGSAAVNRNPMISILAVAELCEPTVWGLCSPASLTTQQVTFMKKYLKKTKTRAPTIPLQSSFVATTNKAVSSGTPVCAGATVHCD